MRRVFLPILLALAVVSIIRPVAAQKPNPDDAKSSQPSNPQLALWLDLKRELQGPSGKQYFDLNLKNALIQGGSNGVHVLRGMVVSGKPAKQPSELVLAMSDSHTPEVTLTLRDYRSNLRPLLKPLAPGTEIEFWGIPVAFTQNPFMLTFEVQAANDPSGANPVIIPKEPRKPKP